MIVRASLSTLIGTAICLSVLSQSALAAEPDYTRVVDYTETEAVLKRNSFTKEEWYRCNFSTLACSRTQSGTSLSLKASTPPFMFAYRALMPPGAQSLLRSPDGRYIAFYIPATQSRKTRTFGVMDTTDLSIYTKEETVSYWDLLTEGIRYYVFSPDAKMLIYLDDIIDETTPYRVDLASLGSQGKDLPSAKMFSRKYTVADIVFKDNETVWFTANRDNPYAWSLYEYSLTTYKLTKLANDVSYEDNLRQVGKYLLFTQNDEKGVRPLLYDTSSGKINYFLLPPWDETESKGKAVTTLKGGLTGVFLLEPSGRSDTLLVWFHGGPYRQSSLGYHPFLSYGGYDWVLENVRDSDVGVLKLDYPGSAGFGRVFASSITKKIGKEDAVKAAAAIADFAKRNSYKNVYLMGNSYGGYLALKLLVDNPSMYKAAFSINGVADWMTLLTRLDTSIFNVQFGGTVDEGNRKNYQEASIYNYTDRLEDQKVVLMHGDSDSTVPSSQSEGLATYLTLIQKNVQFIKLAGEDHVYKKPESFVALCKTTFAFVNRSNTASCEL